MVHFVIGAVLSAAVIGAANSVKFKRAVNKSRRVIKEKIDYAKAYAGAIDEVAKERMNKSKKKTGNEK
ncbi:MAG: hypothetical protein LBO72_07455 [Helicobacteraceae bacterium]|jgi:hypothetical protein|nr:hypothetical protein [Helicobacteraceae bacterium]